MGKIFHIKGHWLPTVLAIFCGAILLWVLLGAEWGIYFGISMGLLAFVNVSAIAFYEDHYRVRNFLGMTFMLKYSDPLRMGMRRKNSFSFTVLRWKRIPFLFIVGKRDEALLSVLENIEEADRKRSE